MRAFAKLAAALAFTLISGCSTVTNLFDDEEEAKPMPLQIAGEANLREKILLAPGATLRVTIEDVSLADAKADILAEEVNPLPVTPAPYAFALDVDRERIDPAHRYVVRAQIRDAAGALRFTTTQAYPVLTGGSPNNAYVLLEAVAEPTSTVSDPWLDAKARGVTFRGLGQEPGWMVDIVEGRTISLLLDYGETRVEAAAPKPEPLFNGWRYTVEKPTVFSVEILDKPCQDVMSGEDFPSAVNVYLSGRVLNGCGRRL